MASGALRSESALHHMALAPQRRLSHGISGLGQGGQFLNAWKAHENIILSMLDFFVYYEL